MSFESVSEEVQNVVAAIPLFANKADVAIAPLADVISLNNASYRVRSEGQEYLLRIAAETARYLGIRRSEESESAQAAARAGVAPKVFYADGKGHMVMQFIEGRHWEPEEFHTPANIARIASTLRRLHDVKNVAAEGSVYRRVERLYASAQTLGLELPAHWNAYQEKMNAIEATRQQDTRFRPGLSHNDFWQNNFLDDGQNLWLVDWEFSGNGDGLFDLTTISMGSRYSEEETERLLHEYGYREPGDLPQLETMKFMVWLFEAFWSLVQHGLRGSNGYDYQAHSRRMFDALDAHLAL